MGEYIVLKIGRACYPANQYIPAFQGRASNRIPEPDFYPQEALKMQNKSLTLHLAGVGKFNVNGIYDFSYFRLRNDDNVGQFYALHGLGEEDSVVIERIGERLYSIYPYRG